MDSKAASDQLVRILSFFPRVDSKASALFAIASTMIGVLATRINVGDSAQWQSAASAAFALALLVYALFELFRCAYPDLKGDAVSHVFFRAIARQEQQAYIGALAGLGEDAWLRDLAGQIWCNSRILTAKYAALKRAFVATLGALLPWALAISLTGRS